MRLHALVLCTFAAAQLATAATQVNFTAQLVTIGGNPFGLTSADRLRVLTGRFLYESAPDTNPSVSQGNYQLSQNEVGFSATLGGGTPATFTGTTRPTMTIVNTSGSSGDSFEYQDGVGTGFATRFLSFNGVPDSDAYMRFYIQAGSESVITTDALPTTFGWGTSSINFPHTFSISDGLNGTLLFQLMTVSVGSGGPTGDGLVFVPVAPCRVADTRPSQSLAAAETRLFNPQGSTCGIPSTARTYSLNVTVVPKGPLAFLTVFPAGQPLPNVSTLNSLDGRVKANAAIVPAGTVGSISVYATNPTDVVLDINGYFTTPTENGLYFYPLPPCRLVDTRSPNGSLGGPAMVPLQARTIPVLSAGCGVPFTAQAYSLNATVVPSEPFAFLSMWPTGSTRPNVSTLNALTGTVTANAAIVPAGLNGSIDVYGTHNSHLVLDVNGYFAPAGGVGALRFFTVNPCRVSDSRIATPPYGGLPFAGGDSRDYTMPGSCGISPSALALSLNVTVVPSLQLGFLTLYPEGQVMPTVSTLNALDGAITSNAAILPVGTNGAIRAYVTNQTHVIFDTNGYFAP